MLSTIERRYRFSSTAAGLIASTFDMAVLVSVLFISYFGGKGHKPRWLGISLIIQGLGECIVVAIRALICSMKHAVVVCLTWDELAGGSVKIKVLKNDKLTA